MWETVLKLLAKKRESGLELEVGVQRAWGCLVGEESAGQGDGKWGCFRPVWQPCLGQVLTQTIPDR